jgi:hypothetical protein
MTHCCSISIEVIASESTLSMNVADKALSSCIVEQTKKNDR